MARAQDSEPTNQIAATLKLHINVFQSNSLVTIRHRDRGRNGKRVRRRVRERERVRDRGRNGKSVRERRSDRAK